MTRLITLMFAAMAMAGMAAAETVYVHAGKLLAVPGQGYLSEQTLVIEDGVISSVRPGYVTPPASARLVNKRDAFVLPGLPPSPRTAGSGSRLQTTSTSAASPQCA